MLKAYKFRIYPTKTQEQQLVQAMGCARYIYNKGLEVKIAEYQKTGKTLSYFDLSGSWLSSQKLHNEWLRKPYSQTLCQSLLHLDNAFTRFFKKNSKFPRFKSKRDGGQSISFTQGVAVDWGYNKVWIPKCGKVKIVLSRKFDGKIKTCTVSKTPTGKFFISILVDDGVQLPEKQPVNPDSVIGIDLGIKTFATLSDGSKIDNPKYLAGSLKKLARLQRRTSRKQKGSKNRKKSQRKVAQAYETITNQRKDFLHKASTQIVRDNQTIILEDLNVAGMLRNHKLARSIADCGWGMFVQFLKYKAEWQGKNIVFIGRFEPSSKTCSCCGYVNPNLTLKDREWNCPNCKTHHDRDINAAINIKKFGLIKLSRSGEEVLLNSNTGSERPAEPTLRKKRSATRKRAPEIPEANRKVSPAKAGKRDRRSRKPRKR